MTPFSIILKRFSKILAKLSKILDSFFEEYWHNFRKYKHKFREIKLLLKILYLLSLIPISLNEIIDNNIKSKLLSLTSPYFTRYPKCSHLSNELHIKFEEYEPCLNCIYTQVKYPYFLIFYFL